MSARAHEAARVLLVRHGEAAYEAKVVNDEGGSLTPTGRRQAADLGRRLRGEGLVGVWTSPMSRAVQTAEIAAAAVGTDEVHVRERLREYGVGALAGRSGSGYEMFAAIMDAWLDGDAEARIPEGERIDDFAERQAAELEAVADAAEGRGPALVVSHGGAIGVVVTRLDATLPAGWVRRRWLPNCSVVELERSSEGEWRLVDWAGEGRGSSSET